MNKQGITLLELLITITVISVLAIIGLVSFYSIIDEQNAQAATEQIAFAIKKAKSYSKIHGVSTKLNLVSNSGTYSITADGQTITKDSNFDATSGVLPENIKILSSNCSDMNFYIDGSFVDSNETPITNDCTVTIGTENGIKKELTIKSGVGIVEY